MCQHNITKGSLPCASKVGENHQATQNWNPPPLQHQGGLYIRTNVTVDSVYYNTRSIILGVIVHSICKGEVFFFLQCEHLKRVLNFYKVKVDVQKGVLRFGDFFLTIDMLFLIRIISTNIFAYLIISFVCTCIESFISYSPHTSFRFPTKSPPGPPHGSVH